MVWEDKIIKLNGLFKFLYWIIINGMKWNILVFKVIEIIISNL